MSDLVQEIIDTGKAIAQSTTAVLRHAKFVSLSGQVATIELGGGQVQANMLFAGSTPAVGSEVLVLQQGYELLLIGPLDVPTSSFFTPTAPTTPDVGTIWTESDAPQGTNPNIWYPTYMWDGTKWVSIGGLTQGAADVLYVKKTGDTMSGDLAVQKATAKITASATSGEGLVHAISSAAAARLIAESSVGAAIADLRAPVGQTASVYFRSGTSLRWHLYRSSATESGGNVGSELVLQRHDDAGTALGAVFTMSRATGLITVAGDPTGALGVATKQYVDNRTLHVKSTLYTDTLAAAIKSGGNQTGYLLITLPKVVGSNPMLTLKVKGFEYAAAGGEWEINLGGYCYSASPTWVNTSSRCAGLFPGGGRTLPVRFLVKGAVNNADYAIAVGDAGTVWNYPQVAVEAMFGFSGASLLESGISAAFTTDISTWTAAVTETPEAHPTLTGVGASGTWPISISGNADSVDGFHFAWRNDNAQRTYLLTADAPGDVHLVPPGLLTVSNSDMTDGLHVHAGRNSEANKIVRTDGNGYIQAGYINSNYGNENQAASPPRVWGTNGSDDYLRTFQAGYLTYGHSHNRTGSGYQIAHVDVGSLAANTAYGPASFGHSNPQGINGASATCTYDDNTHSITASIGNLWDSVNIQVVYRNVGPNAESGAVCVVVFA